MPSGVSVHGVRYGQAPPSPPGAALPGIALQPMLRQWELLPDLPVSGSGGYQPLPDGSDSVLGLEPLPARLDLARYVRERVYPFPGEPVRAVLLCERDLLSDVLDRFGMETHLRDNGDGTFDAAVFTGAAGLIFWALQYLGACQVLEPLWLRQEIGNSLQAVWENYRKDPETSPSGARE